MPLTQLQADIARLISINRSPASHLAGGAALHIEPDSLRASNDLDYFHDAEALVGQAFAADRNVLETAGYGVEVTQSQPGFVRAIVGRDGDATKVDWAHDSSWRFLPPVMDPFRHRPIARKRDLWWQFTVRAVEARYRGSYLGILWAVLNPVLMLSVYFRRLRGHLRRALPGPEGRDPSRTTPWRCSSGLTLYQLLAETLGAAPLLITWEPNLVKKVVFPLEILPLAQAGGLWFNLAIGLVLALGGWLVIGKRPELRRPSLAAGHPRSPPHALGRAGVALRRPRGLLPRPRAGHALRGASDHVFERGLLPRQPDPPHVWGPKVESVPCRRWCLAARSSCGAGPSTCERLGYTYAAGVASLILGRWVFQKLRPAFADVI
jgi:lipopolysaccharide transport system permease protein